MVVVIVVTVAIKGYNVSFCPSLSLSLCAYLAHSHTLRFFSITDVVCTSALTTLSPTLPTGRKHIEATEEGRQRPTPGSGEEGRARGIADGVSRESLGRTSRDMGHIREAEGEALVVGIVPGRALVCNDL